MPDHDGGEPMLYGYAGKVLHVDLTSGSLKVEEPAEAFYRTYLGGSALGVHYLLRNTPPGADPLGPENTLTFAVSAFTGAPISGQARCSVVARSPLTNAVGSSESGGFFPAELKFAGFDAIVVRGASARPVYLWVKDGSFELRDAGHLWGRPTSEVDRILKEELGDDRIQVAQAGPAGERGVRFAAIMNMANRANGRGGLGAVMAAKGLKAVVVRGTKKGLRTADPEALRRIMKASQPRIMGDPDVEDLAIHGTSGIVEYQDGMGGLPTRNWQSGTMGGERAVAIAGATLFRDYLRGAAAGTQMKDGRDTCYSCGVRCKRVVEAEWAGRALRPECGGPEYETVSVFGSYCDVTDLGAVVYANQLCNEHGVDTISAGATMAFAIECFERGLITTADTDGIALRWGDAGAMIAMLEKTLRREGFGDILAEGSSRAAERIGGDAGRYVMAVKQQELPAHMPQVKASLALVYAVNPYGADHQSSEHDPFYEPETLESRPEKYAAWMADIGLTNPQPARALNEEKARFALRTHWAYQAMNSAGACQFVFGPGWQLMGMGELAASIAAVTGWDLGVDELLAIGERTLNLQRAANAREGFTREDDTLPRRLFDEPLQGGASDGRVVPEAEWEAARAAYYRLAGWDPATGNPTPATLERLGLGWVGEA
ncbi:MAG: aldehyde ferredoxin oxidoreductase family protein [Actinobacteria bacterium]|nr:aldehyde ferredoxin oxidoreductase family protein [Actinomycetota bacterium]